MKRLTEYSVASGLRTAWRLATCPTSRCPSSVNATTDGVVRPPSALGMTSAWPPSIVAATTELIVPRSMPTAFAMRCSSQCPGPHSALGHARRPSSHGAQLVQRLAFDLTHAFGRHAEVHAELTEGSWRRVEAVVRADDGALAVAQDGQHARDLTGRDARRHAVEGVLGARVRQQVAGRVSAAGLGGRGLVKPVRPQGGGQ